MEIARATFGWDGAQKSFYTTSRQLQELLTVLGAESKKYRSISKWRSMPDCAIARVNYNDKTGNWHWVVFCRIGDFEYVLDPRSKLERRTDFNRMRLMSCIPIGNAA